MHTVARQVKAVMTPGHTQLHPTYLGIDVLRSIRRKDFALRAPAYLPDIQILVDCPNFPGTKTTFNAHKIILALNSVGFKAMFYEDPIVITDLHPDGVEGLLRYFYGTGLKVSNVLQATRTRVAAAKYVVPELVEKCLAYVNSFTQMDEVSPVLDHALTKGEEGLLDGVSALIRRETLGVISSSKFPSSTELTVRFILAHAINVPEVSVVNTVYDWAQPQSRSGVTANGQGTDVRAIMLPLFPELRFLALTSDEFIRGPIQWQILTDSEALAILGNIVFEGSILMPKGICQIREARGNAPK